MIQDGREIPQGTVIETDLCIVGAGAAGITLAREFIGSPLRVCMLESGGLEFDPKTQDLYKGENVGRHYHDLDVCRLRYFGGTTNHWSGFCRPLTPTDFEERSWVPYSGWPFGYEELEPFYRRAREICQLAPVSTNGGAQAPTAGSASLPFDESRIVTETYQLSPPTRFGSTYRPDIQRADNLLALLNSNVVEIETADSGREITRLQIATLTGNRFSVSARRFVLATGGIENARLLLVSNVGNQNDLVGRFFMEHPEPNIGFLLPSNPEDNRWFKYVYDIQGKQNLQSPISLSLHKSIQEKEQILNCSVGLGVQPTTHSEGSKALGRLGRMVKSGGSPRQFGSDLWGVIAGIDGVATDAYHELRYGYLRDQFFRIHCYGQQAPNPDSRITLAQERDALGLPRVRLDWRLSELDKRSVRRTLEILALETGSSGLGRIKIEFRDWPPQFWYGNHHMGTTRMNADPRRGVVDATCRVHGIRNLYIAGSSVFPTGSASPPTLTIVAMSLRLADHIKGAP